MVEDSSGAHILLQLQISHLEAHLEAARNQRPLSMAQVRLVLTSCLGFSITSGVCIDAAPNSWTGWTWWGICVEIEEATNCTATGMIRFGVASVYCYFLGLYKDS